MALLYAFPRHRLVGRDVPCTCNQKRGGWECMFCSGGLAYCVVCRGGESSLPTCCPRAPMPGTVQNAVSAGLCDYDVRLGWIQVSNDHHQNNLWRRRT